jgi:hypothetical protein
VKGGRGAKQVAAFCEGLPIGARSPSPELARFAEIQSFFLMRSLEGHSWNKQKLERLKKKKKNEEEE